MVVPNQGTAGYNGTGSNNIVFNDEERSYISDPLIVILMAELNRMKYLLLIFLNCISILLLAQKNSRNIELSSIVTHEKETIRFVKNHFQDVRALDDVEKVFHPMGSVKFNKELKENGIKYTIFGKPIDLLFAFYDEKESDKYAIYIILDIPRNELKMFSKIWGHPENVPTEDFVSGDFDSQIWRENGADVIVGRSFLYEYSADSQLIQISNIKLAILYGIE